MRFIYIDKDIYFRTRELINMTDNQQSTARGAAGKCKGRKTVDSDEVRKALHLEGNYKKRSLEFD